MVGDRYDETVVLGHIADVHCATGEIPLAWAARQQSLDILTELDHPDADAIRAALDYWCDRGFSGRQFHGS